MEMFSDDFISYNNELNVKLEKSSDHEISLDSPSLKTCESTPNLFPMNFSPSLQSLLIKSVSIGATLPKKNQPFTIIKAKKEDDNDHLEVKIESEDKILNKSKLIMKREKAKQRAMTRVNKPIYLKLEADVESEAPDTVCNEPKNKKKVLQMIRNRISAQTSRDRKKAYLYTLEDAKNKLHNENSLLKHQNTTLLLELTKLKEANKKLSSQNQELKGRSNMALEDANEEMLKNISGYGNLKEVEVFANMLSTIVSKQFDGDKTNIFENFNEKVQRKGMQEEVDHLITADEKQNTIFHHLSELSKVDKKTFSKASKENYNSHQSIFSLTNFDLTDAGADFGLLKEIKQEESQYAFGMKPSNLL